MIDTDMIGEAPFPEYAPPPNTEDDIKAACRYLQRLVDAGVTCPTELRRKLQRYFFWTRSLTTCKRYVDHFLIGESPNTSN